LREAKKAKKTAKRRETKEKKARNNEGERAKMAIDLTGDSDDGLAEEDGGMSKAVKKEKVK
jgi:hypothetical protein